MFDITTEDLINITNEGVYDDTNKVQSKFSIIIAVAKRARQLIAEKDYRIENENPLSVAVEEFKKHEIQVIVNRT